MADLTQHWRSLYAGEWLGAWDLWDRARGGYREVEARIDDVQQRECTIEGGRRELKWVLLLSGRKGPIKTPMILSNPNGKTLEVMFGEAPSGWIGKTIRLYVKKDKMVRKGTGAVLTIRNSRANDELKAAIRREGPAIPEDEFTDGNGNGGQDSGQDKQK